MALLFTRVSSSQVNSYPTPTPEFSAAAAWQLSGEPLVVNGILYFPTRAFRLFDAQVMVQSGVYQGVPIYADVTLEPYSIVYVPVSPSNMRVYERRRDGALAGTTGSRTPSFPVEIASPIVFANTQRAYALAASAGIGSAPAQNPPADIRSPGADSRMLLPMSTTGLVVDHPRPQHTRIEVIPSPAALPVNGVWLEFNGTRWYADGASAPFSPDRFEPIGDYRGFTVYRARQGDRNAIWVAVVKGGPVAPYKKQ
jgi:hypothetical protein